MKKLYFAFLSLFIVGAGNAQITQANHAPALNDFYNTVLYDSTGISPGASGAGAVWSFTNAASIRSVVTAYSCTTAASTASASAYPSASVTMVSSGSSAYYSSTGSKLQYWGGTLPFKIQGFSIALTYTGTAAATAMPYTAILNSSVTSAVSGTLSSPTSSTVSGYFSGTWTVNVDGYGTLKLGGTPVTFTNVSRAVTTQSLNFNVTAPLPVSGNVFYTIYDYYYIAKSKFPMFTIATAVVNATVFGNPSTTTQTMVTLNSDYTTVGIDEISNSISNLAVYPNPVKNNLNLSFTNTNADEVSYELFNTVGQVVKQDKLGNEKGEVKKVLNVSGLDAGTYILKLDVGKSTSVKKINIQ